MRARPNDGCVINEAACVYEPFASPSYKKVSILSAIKLYNSDFVASTLSPTLYRLLALSSSLIDELT